MQQGLTNEGLLNFADATVASWGAVVFTNPMEVVKTRLQLQGELRRRGEYHVHYRGLWHTAVKVYQNEGIRGLQRGLAVSIIHQMLLNGVRLGVYSAIQESVEDAMGFRGVLVNMPSGAVAGMIGAVTGNPLFLVKIRLMSRSDVVQVGTQHSYHSWWGAIKNIVETRGVLGLFQGTRIAMIRTAVASAAQLTSYELVKSRCIDDYGCSVRNWRVHLLASTVAGFCFAFFANPLDVILTRSYNNHEAYSRKSKKNMRAVARIEGLSGFYKGWTALWLRIGPHTMLTFVFLEQVKMWRERRLATRYSSMLQSA